MFLICVLHLVFAFLEACLLFSSRYFKWLGFDVYFLRCVCFFLDFVGAYSEFFGCRNDFGLFYYDTNFPCRIWS